MSALRDFSNWVKVAGPSAAAGAGPGSTAAPADPRLVAAGDDTGSSGGAGQPAGAPTSAPAGPATQDQPPAGYNLQGIAIVRDMGPVDPSELQFKAIGVYSNGAKVNLTDKATWFCYPEYVAIMDKKKPGHVEVKGAGKASISAKYAHVRGRTNVTVKSPRDFEVDESDQEIEGDKMHVGSGAVELEEDTEFELTGPYYEIALQGTTGRFKEAKEAVKLAREIAERCPDYVNKTQKAKKLSDGDAATFRKYFLDALQGAASNQELKTADAIVATAGEEAYLSLAEHLKTRARLHWKHITLPQPMDADCKPVDGKVHGPPNHKLCEFHEHIIDMETKMVIAHSLEEYQKLFPKK